MNPRSVDQRWVVTCGYVDRGRGRQEVPVLIPTENMIQQLVACDETRPMVLQALADFERERATQDWRLHIVV